MPSPRVVALVGATATGKTAAGEALADALGAEVVCCDSRQVFAELQVGTGKPSPAERAARPHHLFDALALGARPSAGWYAGVAREACAAISARGALPLLVGGTGLYLAALMRGIAASPPHDASLRAGLAAALEGEGAAALHRRLAEVDPTTAARLAPRDAQRVTRALEVWQATGRPLSWWHAHRHRPGLAARWRVIELTATPAELAPRIETRTRWMFDHGLVEETRAIVEAGAEAALSALRAVGYDEALAVAGGRLDRASAEAITSRRTRQLAKRQRTWFRHQTDAVRVGTGGRTMREVIAAALEAAR